MQFKTPKFLFLLSVVLVVGFGQQAQAQIQIDGFTDAVNDRFTNDSSFILDGFDISAVGRNGSQWATAISPNVVISSYHARPGFNSGGAIGRQVTFYPSNDPDGTAVTRTIVSNQRISNSSSGALSDLWVGVLDSNLPSSITPVAYTTQNITAGPVAGGTVNGSTLNTSVPFAGDEVFLFGRSQAAQEPGIPGLGQAVGRNTITGFFQDATFEGSTDSLYAAYDSFEIPNSNPALQPPFTGTSANLVANEAHLVTLDSGAPLFTVDNGDLLLLGTNGFVSNITVTVNGTATVETIGSGFDYVGNESAFIDNFIATNAVPEPSSALALSAVLGAFLVRRRRIR